MRQEHAIAYTDRLSVSGLDYIVRKANRLGRIGRDIVGVHEEKDIEGTHIYFDVTEVIGEQGRNSRKV